MQSPEFIAEATVRLQQRGGLTLPKALRDWYGLVAGDVLRVLDVGGVFVVAPGVPTVPELAREIEHIRIEAGLSAEELLGGLRRERERYARERFGVETNDASGRFGENTSHGSTPSGSG